MKKLCALVLVFLTAGCSKLNIVYDYGSYKLKSTVSDSYNFKSTTSENKVLASWNKSLVENKKIIFKDLGVLISEVQTITSAEQLTSDSIDFLYTNTKIKQKKLIDLFSMNIELTVNELGASEIENFKIYNIKKINENKDKDIKLKFLDRTEDVIEYLFDTITKEQLKISGQFFEDNKLHLLGQKERRLNFVNTFTSLFPDKEKMKAYMISYYSADESIRTAEYKKQVGLFETNCKKFILDIWSTLTAEQKREFQKTLAELKEQLDKI